MKYDFSRQWLSRQLDGVAHRYDLPVRGGYLRPLAIEIMFLNKPVSPLN